jgi:MEMO1 family protein
MNPIQCAYIMPHPPIILPEIGQGRESVAKSTIESCKRIASEVVSDRPDTIILSTPHAWGFEDSISLMEPEKLQGDLAAFGHPEIRLAFQGDPNLTFSILETAKKNKIPAGILPKNIKERHPQSSRLDHGAFIPLYFIKKELDRQKHLSRLIVLSTPFLPLETLYRFGHCMRDALITSGQRIVYLASGDLSHRLTIDAPAGYHPQAYRFDQMLVDHIDTGNFREILKYTDKTLENAGECGTRSFIMMYGALNGCNLHTDIYSYEGPFGVGYLSARIAVSGSEYVRLAKASLKQYIKDGKIPSVPKWTPEFFISSRSGVFVSIKKRDELRGCIGTILPTRSNLAEEIIHNAIAAGAFDPRFPPVTQEEMEELEFSVDILRETQPIDSMEELDPKRFGVIVSKEARRGLLLPNLHGIDTPDQQVEIALQKAGIAPDEKYTMERFEVIRHY